MTAHEKIDRHLVYELRVFLGNELFGIFPERFGENLRASLGAQLWGSDLYFLYKKLEQGLIDENN